MRVVAIIATQETKGVAVAAADWKMMEVAYRDF